MREELVNALIQLFAIFSEENKKLEYAERNYIKTLLCHYLAEKDAERHLLKFEDLKLSESKKNGKNKDQKLTSVKDSVRVLGICNNLNKSLDHKQKIIVIIRLFEIVSISNAPSDPRINIINSVSKIFNVTENEFYNITSFITKTDIQKFFDPSLLIITSDEDVSTESKIIYVKGIDDNIIFLYVKSADLYFFRYNGTKEIFYNGLPVNKKIICQFAYGGIIKLPFGKPFCYSEIIKQYSKEAGTEFISFNVRNLSYRSGDFSLRNINISEKEGGITGIFCEEGTVNSELLKLLYGNTRPDEGDILINNINLHKEKGKLYGALSYLPGEDLLFEDLTVFENLWYNARFCLNGKSGKEITGLINNLLAGLDIAGIKDIIAGKDSGAGKINAAQRKRINFAMELIREPSILFVDRPDLGLGYLEYNNIVDLLCELSQKGKLVFASISRLTPHVFKTFDKLMILDKKGDLIYYGKPEDIPAYFQKIGALSYSLSGECESCGTFNPEVISKIINAETIDDNGRKTGIKKVSSQEWDTYFRNNSEVQHIEDVGAPLNSSLRIPSWLKQFRIFMRRNIHLKTADYKHTLFTLIEAPVLALIFSFILRYVSNANSGAYTFRENENIPLFFFVSILISMILGFNITAREMLQDRKRLRRDKLLKISRSGFFLSAIIILFVFAAIQSILFVLAGNLVLNIKGMTFEFWFALFTVTAFANIFGLNISASFSTMRNIWIANIFIIILQVIFSGAILNFNKMNRFINSIDRVPVIAEFMALKWAYEGLMVRQFKDNDFEKDFYDIEKRISTANYRQVYYIPELLKKVDECLYDIRRKDTVKTSMPENFGILENEINAEQINTGLPFKMLDRFKTGSFNNMIGFHTRDYLKKLDTYYSIMYLTATREKEHIINTHIEKDPELFKYRMDRYFNDKVAEIVKNSAEKNKITSHRNRLVQIIDPVYRDPQISGKLDIRTHFFAPEKHFFGNIYNTYWFNMVVIWIMSVLLYITLYFDLFRVIVAFFRKKGVKRFF